LKKIVDESQQAIRSGFDSLLHEGQILGTNVMASRPTLYHWWPNTTFHCINCNYF